MAEGVVSAFRATIVSHRTRKVIAACVTWRLTLKEAEEDARIMIYVTDDPSAFEARIKHGTICLNGSKAL